MNSLWLKKYLSSSHWITSIHLAALFVAIVPGQLLAGPEMQTFTLLRTNPSFKLLNGAFSQQTIMGTVMDKDGITLPGVSVVIKGTTYGTMTDENGSFTLPGVEEDAILVFSYVGYKSVEMPVQGRTSFSVMLEEDTELLEEVVIVGYGTQKKESVIGSIVQASEEELKRTGNTPDLAQALTGQLPGIVTLTTSGEPGGVTTGESATNIFIRGQNTWNGGQPLILVDGVERSMNNIDVNEVASISVLKDASATAVFGVKGANGVILITTKRGTGSSLQEFWPKNCWQPGMLRNLAR